MTLKLWDYLSSGLPVIATDMPGTRTYRELNDYAIFVDPGNEKMMAEAMLQLIENPEKRKRLSVRGRSLVTKRRSWKQAALETDSFIQRQLN
jgi:glycosyltransferase involved in cell wall biosynthesis